MEPDEEQDEEEVECDWNCTHERMQELAREQEQLQEERRLREQQRREEENQERREEQERTAASHTGTVTVTDDNHVELFPEWSWDSVGNRRMREWRQRHEEEEKGRRREEMERKPDEESSSCTGMCRIMRMRTGK